MAAKDIFDGLAWKGSVADGRISPTGQDILRFLFEQFLKY